MINPKVRAAALDFMKSQVRPGHTLEGQELNDVYAAECKLFDEHFKGMTKSEKADYSGFVQWLDNSEMWKSDLTVDGLYEVFTGIEYYLLFECFEDNLDELDF
jgi:hypothetical protein